MYFRREHDRRYGGFRSRERDEAFREPAMYVIDFMELGNPSDRHPEHRNQPLSQGVGVKQFTLLEAVPLPAIRLEILERIELSPHSKVRKPIVITYDDLTSVARGHLRDAVKNIIVENERYFVEFFNIAEPVNIRMHAFELLPNIGKKTMRALIDEREVKRFMSFQDIRDRVKIDPVKVLCERIVKELEGGEKYYLFIKPYDKQGIYLGYLERIYDQYF